TSSAGPAEPASLPFSPPPRSFTTTAAPSRPASNAHSLPMPLPAPVTTTTFPLNTPIFFLRACDLARASARCQRFRLTPRRLRFLCFLEGGDGVLRLCRELLRLEAICFR